MKANRIKILGVPVDCVDMSGALDEVDAMIAGTTGNTVFAVNPEKVMKALDDPALLQHLENAGLLIPDGVGVVFASRLLRLGTMKRVPGSELMPAICERATIKGYKIFLFGAAHEVSDAVARILPSRYPGLKVVGNQHGFLSDVDMPDLVDRINASGAEVLFVALGSPKQEEWMARYLPQLKIRVCQGVGGTFDVIAGKVKRAPVFWRRIHLEWLYRLLSDPKRLMRQKALPKFAWRVLLAKFGW